jgi:hypothetical protein
MTEVRSAFLLIQAIVRLSGTTVFKPRVLSATPVILRRVVYSLLFRGAFSAWGWVDGKKGLVSGWICIH